MAQFNSLLVTGNSRFLNPINGNARNGIYYVKGTQTAATGSWTGSIPVPALYDGLTIMYYLPYNGSGNATLNLTLSDGTTTGAINCYYNQNDRLTTHYRSGNNVVMTYHPAGSITINGSATSDNRWVVAANYTDGNDQSLNDRICYVKATAGSNKIFPYTVVMRLPDGRWESIVTSASTGTSKARNTHGFLFGQIAWMNYNETYNENALISDYRLWSRYTYNVDYRYFCNVANDSTNGLTANKPVYLVGSIGSDGLFYLDTTWWTQTLPSTENGKIYIYIGDAYDYYRASFYGTGNIQAYTYTNGHLREFHQDAATVGGHTVAKDVPSNAEFTDTQSDWNASSGKAQILNKPTIPTVNNGTLTIQKNGTSVATFTANQSGNSTANITVPTITDTYSGTSSDGMSGKAVKSAIDALDGSISGSAGASKTLTAFSQTDGKVSATFGNISITKSQISDFPTIPTVNNGTLTLQKNGSNVATFTANQSGNTTANFALNQNDLKPIVHKTYASTSYYATTGGDSETSTWYFMSVKPDSWYKPWTVKFKMHTFCPSYSSYESFTDATFSGRSDGIIYALWNEHQETAHTYVGLYPLKKAGFDAGYGHAFGVNILWGSNYTNSAYYRTFEIDYCYSENCTVTILDTPVKWSSWTGTGTTNYNSWCSYDANGRGLRESGDDNSYTVDGRAYSCFKAGANKIFPYTFIMQNSDGRWESIVTSSSTGTGKARNTHGFRLNQIAYLSSGSTYNENAVPGWGQVRDYNTELLDHRYSFNTENNSTNGTTANAPVYIVGSMGNDGLFYLDSTKWWTQTLPTSADGKLYIHIGDAYDYYRMTFLETRNVYRYVNGMVRAYTQDAGTVNGLTVQTAVPSGAKFTDTTYPLSTKVIDANYKTAFRTETKGDTASGDYISTIRNDTASVDSSPRYGSGIASGRGDTHMYLYTRYSSEGFFVGGGNADKLNWVSQVYTTGYKPSKSDVGLGNVDNKSSATIRSELTSSNVTTALGYTPPTADTWRPISVKNYSLNDSEIVFKEGSNVSLECSTTTPGVTNLSIGATNTTYTFANGTNGFTVTPSGGSAQTVTVTPSITNNVTGSGTSGYLTKFNGANTITNGPQLGSSTTTYLRNDGSWQTPPNDNNAVTQTSTSTGASYEVLFSATADDTTRTEGARKSYKLQFNPTLSNGASIGYEFKDGTRGDWITDQTCGLLDIAGSSSKNIRLCGDGTVAAEKIICHSIYTYDISSQYTVTKSSGAWSAVSIKAIRCGNVIQFIFRVKGNGSAVSAGTNAFVGTLSGGPLPTITTKLVTFISSTAVVCSISPESDYSSAAITVRVCYPNLTLASGSENEICGTFICP